MAHQAMRADAILALTLLILPLMACGGGALSNDRSAISGVYSAQTAISDHPHHVLIGHVIIADHGARRTHALVIGQRRDGVHRLSFDTAWRDGVMLSFRKEHGTGCTHGHCRDGPVGLILLDRALFLRAQDEGLIARLTGPSGAIDIYAPPALFIEAAERARGL
ncbi:hypothetical protein LSUCC0031_04125 [Rhodobacterales bacterium LSUCC0031]|nr:hypothetical protein [Rhodobacterales bacterium LSUCC0031]